MPQPCTQHPPQTEKELVDTRWAGAPPYAMSEHSASRPLGYIISGRRCGTRAVVWPLSVHCTQDPAQGPERGHMTRVMENTKKRGQPQAREHQMHPLALVSQCQREKGLSESTRNILGLQTPEGAPKNSTLIFLPASAPLLQAAACHNRNPTGSESDRSPALPPTSWVALPPLSPSISSSARQRYNSTCFDESCTCVYPNPDSSKAALLCKLVQPLWKQICQCLGKLNIIQSRNSTPGDRPKRNESVCSQKALCMKVQSGFTHNSPKLGTVRVPTARRLNKLEYFIMWRTYSAIDKNRLLLSTTRMNLENILPNTHCMFPFI